jgi:hypothetical protein
VLQQVGLPDECTKNLLLQLWRVLHQQLLPLASAQVTFTAFLFHALALLLLHLLAKHLSM